MGFRQRYVKMADSNVIGDPTDYVVYIGDNATPGSSVYGWYLKPEHVQMNISTPASVKEQMELGINVVEQLGKLIYQLICKDIHITSFAHFVILKKALMYWATGNGGATYGGFELTVIAKDVNGEEWSKIPSWDAPTTLEPLTTKIINQIPIIPLPNGEYLIKELRLFNFKSV